MQIHNSTAYGIWRQNILKSEISFVVRIQRKYWKCKFRNWFFEFTIHNGKRIFTFQVELTAENNVASYTYCIFSFNWRGKMILFFSLFFGANKTDISMTHDFIWYFRQRLLFPKLKPKFQFHYYHYYCWNAPQWAVWKMNWFWDAILNISDLFSWFCG